MNQIIRKRLYLAAIGLLFALTGTAQFPGFKPSPGDTLKSIRIGANKEVTFSIYAPKATEVTVSGDFAINYQSEKLQKDELGIWSLTIDPLTPDVYSYDFKVDGVKTLDPKNIQVKESEKGYSNYFEIPGKESEYLVIKNVPHGKLEKVWFESKILGKTCRMHVYTPAGYETMTSKLPVLYLQHGGGDNDASWSSVGRANFILDNLLFEGKIKPMIVVMPMGHPTEGFFPGADVDADPYYKHFFSDIIPYIESHYNVLTDRSHRAYAGLSMGGLQALNMALFYPQKFGYVLPLSTGYFPEQLKELEEKHQDILRNPEINKLTLLWIAMGGEKDIAYLNGKNVLALFDKAGHQIHNQRLPIWSHFHHLATQFTRICPIAL